jgi:hypothetical protein
MAATSPQGRNLRCRHLMCWQGGRRLPDAAAVHFRKVGLGEKTARRRGTRLGAYNAPEWADSRGADWRARRVGNKRA